MKTKRVLCVIFAILFLGVWQASVRGQDIPANYIQNPNMEHELNAIFWYGSCCDEFGNNGVVNFSSMYLSDADAHSGNWSFSMPAGSYVWVSYPVRGQEQKRMKASFWYKGYFDAYWNFIYRDIGMTFEDLHPSLAEYVGADTALWGGDGQNSMQFLFGGEDDFTEEWTYFEFVWDMPGTIPGWGNTTMWHTPSDGGYLDDFYYGEWYDGQYSGEEPFDFINGDFEASELNVEWLVNVASWDAFGKDDFLSPMENHTEAGLQSLRLMDYLTVSGEGDTSTNDRNVTYYIPALGAEGEQMELGFWYKGNDARVALEFYDDYGITTSQLPLPNGAMLVSDSANPVYEIDTISVNIDTLSAFIDTMTVVDPMEDEVLMMFIDTMMLHADTVLASQNFDNEGNLRLTEGAWVWSGSNNWGWDDWAAATKDDEAWSEPEALWLPGDPSWGGAEGYVNVVDDTSYIWEFWYIGQLQFILNLGDAKYDVAGDPDGIIPPEAAKDGGSVTWMLDSDYWKKFRYEYRQGTWLADSAADSPASVSFNLIGTYDAADLGFVDNFMVAMGSQADNPVIDTVYVVRKENYDIEITFDIDTLSTTYLDHSAVWDLPAAADWTEWKLNWTNPTSDIGGTLTLFLDSDLPENPDLITPEKATFDDDHDGWTYFDDFFYGITTGIDPDRVSFDLHTYPNPASDVLYLSIQVPLERVEVYNSLGQLRMSLNRPERILQVSGLEDGIYFLNVTDEQGVVHKAKFVKR